MKNVNPYTKNGKILLFTSQDARSLETIEKEGRFFNKKNIQSIEWVKSLL